jgi:hypothetical protein
MTAIQYCAKHYLLTSIKNVASLDSASGCVKIMEALSVVRNSDQNHGSAGSKEITNRNISSDRQRLTTATI